MRVNIYPEAATVGSRRHPLFARLYPAMARAMDDGGMRAHRRSLLTDLRGEVVEVGAGSGANFRYYPSAVRHVTAVEPEPHLRREATRVATQTEASIDVVDGAGEHLPVADASTDTVVFTLVLCSVRDVQACLAEARRVLRAGGEVRFLEHGVAPSSGMARLQWAMDATIYPHLAGGCHVGRDPVRAITDAGFRIKATQSFLWPQASTPISFHTSGVAVLGGDSCA
ncbi:MAG: class I SAM-dependent methyltransferase [Nocardioides sp.]|uniref:class I SAM-dependent methyltransferase n=1 Tax=Nocardioides sp. TaxID=35761 RepID=UPI003D6AD0C1